MLSLNFNPFPELGTERLLLRRVRKEDAADIFFLRSDFRILHFIYKEPAATIKEAEDFIETINKGIDNNEFILWGIAMKDSPERLIGTICFWQVRKEDHRAEIGYVLHPDHWRKVLMKEAILKVVECGINEMGLHSIDAGITAGNIASGAILEATGFVKEGHFRENVFFQGKFHDTIMYARLQ